jgi:hypothetical protein
MVWIEQSAMQPMHRQTSLRQGDNEKGNQASYLNRIPGFTFYKDGSSVRCDMVNKVYD